MAKEAEDRHLKLKRSWTTFNWHLSGKLQWNECRTYRIPLCCCSKTNALKLSVAHVSLLGSLHLTNTCLAPTPSQFPPSLYLYLYVTLSLCISMSRRFSLNSLTCALPHHWSIDLALVVGIVYLTLSLNTLSFSFFTSFFLSPSDLCQSLFDREKILNLFLSLSLSLSLSWCLSHSLTLLPLSWAPSHWCCCLSKYSFSLSLTNSHFLFLSVT